MVMANEADDHLISQQHHPAVLYSHSPKPIVVEAQDFQTLVQSLTSGKRKRKAAEDGGGVLEQAPSSEQQQSEAKGQVQTLLEYLDRLDQECVPLSRAAANRGFFATAGLVKGVKMEDGLQQFDGSESPRGPLNALPALDDVAAQEPLSKGRSTAKKVLTPLQYCLPRCKLVCSEWAPEWSGCLSPRTLQVITHAKRTALWAASGNRPSSGPWKISLESIADVDRSSSEGEERGLPVDILYYKGEVTIVGPTE